MDQFYDVAVIGAGPSGIAAAVYASKAGAKTVLLEKDSVIGGTAFKAHDSTLNGQSLSFMDGLLHGITKKAWGNIIFDPEELLDRYYYLLENHTISVLSGHEVMSVEANGKKITSVVCSSSAGKSVISAKIIIDASGTLAVENLTGTNDSTLPSYMYMTGLIGKVEAVGGKCYTDEAKKLLLEKIAQAQELGKLDKNLFIEIHPTIRADIAHITIRYDYNEDSPGFTMRKQMNAAVGFLQSFGYGFENVSLISSSKEVFSPAQGSFNAKYTLTLEDITQNRYFNDQVAALPDGDGDDDRIYYIPYGALLSKSFENLLLCGRNIGATANAIRRIDAIPTHFETGKAAGIAVGIAIKNDMPVGEVSAYEIKSKTERSVSDKIEVMNEALGTENQSSALADAPAIPEPLKSAAVSIGISKAFDEDDGAKAKSFEALDKALSFLDEDNLKPSVQAPDADIQNFSEDLSFSLNQNIVSVKKSEEKENDVESLFDKLGDFSEIAKNYEPQDEAKPASTVDDAADDSPLSNDESILPEKDNDNIPVDTASQPEENRSAVILNDYFEDESLFSSAPEKLNEEKPQEKHETDEKLIDATANEPVAESLEPLIRNEVTTKDDILSLLYDTDEKQAQHKESAITFNPNENIVANDLSLLYEEKKPAVKKKPDGKDKVDSMLDMIYEITDPLEKKADISPEEAFHAELMPKKNVEKEDDTLEIHDKFKSIKDFLYDNDDE